MVPIEDQAYLNSSNLFINYCIMVPFKLISKAYLSQAKG